MSYTITAPGIYDMPAEAYHADPCPTPSLSASNAFLLVKECPAKLAWSHPRLNPAFEPRESETFDVGKAAHLIILERDQFAARTVVIDADDWRSKAAREARDAARAEGKTPLLRSQADRIEAMSEALLRNAVARLAFSAGAAEQSVFWQESEHGVWCRCRPDWLPEHGGHIVDYKTFASASPADFQRRAYDLGYHQRAAWYVDGWAAVTGRDPETIPYWFVLQEKEPPYLVTTVRLSPYDIEAGRLLNCRAIATFARCLATGEWPGYRDPRTPDRDGAIEVNLPHFAHLRIQDVIDRPAIAAPPPALVVAKRSADKLFGEI